MFQCRRLASNGLTEQKKKHNKNLTQTRRMNIRRKPVTITLPQHLHVQTVMQEKDGFVGNWRI